MSRGPSRELSRGLASLGHAGCGQPESAEPALYRTATLIHYAPPSSLPHSDPDPLCATQGGSVPKRAQAEEAEREKTCQTHGRCEGKAALLKPPSLG